MNQNLRDAIATQYTAFRAPRPSSIVACPCCNTPERVGRLLGRPREPITADEITFYALKAVTTIGGPDEFRYFWPRLVELLVSGQLAVDPEVVFGKVQSADHERWQRRELEALKSLASALGRELGSEELEPSQVDSWVCSIGLLSEGLWDIAEFLRPLADPTPAARENLRGLIEWNTSSIAKTRLSNAFWSKAPVSASRVLEWLSSDPAAIRASRELAERSAQLYGTTTDAGSAGH